MASYPNRVHKLVKFDNISMESIKIRDNSIYSYFELTEFFFIPLEIKIS